MAIKYQGITGQIYLAGKQLASGGEGIIFEIEGNRSQVIKIFKAGKRDGGREEKLREMVQAHLSEEAQEEITWPQDIVYNKEGFVGYVMPRIEKCESLASVYNSGANGYYDLRYRLLVAVNLCYAIQTVHEMGQVCGDLNPQNISVNLDTSDKNAFHVTLMDADSYHFTSGNKTYRCEVGLGDYIAPEIQNRMSEEVTLKTMALPTYTKETDLFALAVHIFSLLMNGCHPFACAKASGNGQDKTLRQMSSHYVRDSVATPQPIENIRNGYFPFYEKREGIVPPVYAPEFEALPERLRELFVKTFVYGHSNPKKRATTEEWIAALYEAKNNIVSCGKEHYYFGHVAQCPMCSVEERIVALLGRTETGSSSERVSSSETTGETGTNKSAPPYGGRNVGTAKKRRWNNGKVVAAIASIVILSVFMIIGLLYAPTSVTRNYDEQSMQEETQSEVLQSKEEEEQKKREAEQKRKEKIAEEKKAKADAKKLKKLNPIISLLKKGNFKKARKLTNKYWYNHKFKKIYVQHGKIVSTIKSGKGFVIDGDGYSYYGQFKNGKLSGNGTLVNDNEGIKGKFYNGYPNGKCTVVEQWGDVLIGKYKNGWENGSFKCIDNDDKYPGTYYFTSVMGKRKVKWIDGEGRYVYAETRSGNYYSYYSKESQLSGHHLTIYKKKK